MSIEADQLVDSLRESGWLPQDYESVLHREDLLRSLHAAWSTQAGDQADTTTSWLHRALSDGWHLNLLSDEFPNATHWLGERLLLWSRARPSGRLVGVASSRIGRRLDSQADWFTVFRGACSKINRQHDVLLTAAATTPGRFVYRAAERFGIEVLSIVPANEDESLNTWRISMQALDSDVDPTVRKVYLSPPLKTTGRSAAESSISMGVPATDKAVVALSQQLLVFHLRKSGNLDSLVRARLSDSAWPQASVLLALGDGLIDRKVADELLDLGAVGWVVLDTLRSAKKLGYAALRHQASTQQAPIVEVPDNCDGEWLTHCTRDQTDGWPDESSAEYVDRLLSADCRVDRSAFEALKRIVSTRKLIATSRMIRGSTSVVSFTAVPPTSLFDLRTFRSHVGRWDFEPYAICIRRDWLEKRACQPVQYGDESLWSSLSALDQPFFQVAASAKQSSQTKIDWTIEQEWRHVGDVDLSQLPGEQAIIIVPTEDEAEAMAAISPWPVAVLAPKAQ